jgi:hypothetical protein
LRGICIKFGTNRPIIVKYIAVVEFVKAKVVLGYILAIEFQINRLILRIQVFHSDFGANPKRITALRCRFKNRVGISLSKWVCFLFDLVISLPVSVDLKITV